VIVDFTRACADPFFKKSKKNHNIFASLFEQFLRRLGNFKKEKLILSQGYYRLGPQLGPGES